MEEQNQPAPSHADPQAKLVPREKTENELNETVFEDILEVIGSRGKFQRRFNIIFPYLSVFIVVLPHVSFTVSIPTPDHWCYVPGREKTNISLEEWKNLTIPREEEGFSKCLMFKNIGEYKEKVPCEYGWEYDKTWYTQTITSQENWVCDKKIYMTQAISISRGLAILLGLTFCYVGDRFGRRKQFILTVAAMFLGRIISIFTPSIFALFVFAITLAEAGVGSAMESSISVALEMTDIYNRSSINVKLYLCYTLAYLISPLIAWAVRNWMYFMIITSIPCCVPLLLYKYFTESPRWLITKGKPDEALGVIRRIAATNGRKVPENAATNLHEMSRKTVNFSVINIMTNQNLLKNSLLLLYSRCVNVLVVYTVYLNIGNLGTNPFLLLILIGFAQAPGRFFAYALTKSRLGRRFSNCLSMMLTTMLNICIICILSFSGPKWLELCCIIAISSTTSTCSVISNLQSLEIHPTSVRQTAVAIENAFIGISMTVAPYIVYLGQVSDARYVYGIQGLVTAIAVVMLSFMPESMHEKLPETLEDASNYGRYQRYWSLTTSKKLHQRI